MNAAVSESTGAQRLDSFPYRHRVRGVMGAPPQFIAASETVRHAAERMRALKIGALLVADAEPGRALGIVTERDVLNAVARDGAAALAEAVAVIMSTPVETVPENALLHVAMGRMERLNIRHLAAVDRAGRVVGVVSARALLRLRAGASLALGDAVATASDAADLRRVFDQLPALARGLLADEVSAVKIAGVISGTLRDMTGRATELAQAAMVEDGWGGPPARYTMLVLGSGGRGESLLAADQDNALVYEGVHDGQDGDDRWFAELGRRACDMLHEAGIPHCKGGVMASNPAWRHSLDGWRGQIADWIRRPQGERLLNVDIFYDFRRAEGDPELADRLRQDAATAAAAEPMFVRLLAQETETPGGALTLLGQFRTEQGRVDLKKGGLFPLVAFARVAALKRGILETGTGPRLAAAAAAGAIPPDEALRLRQAQEALLGFILQQQLDDLAAGIAPSTRIDPARLSRPDRARLKDTLRALEAIPLLLRDALG
ncbi:MAG: CBS domain-containing protein [Rhodospirillales bacterium]|nr:CBS domain-containing protein [Rhodospirillales bacterium]